MDLASLYLPWIHFFVATAIFQNSMQYQHQNAAAACYLTHINSALHPTTFILSIYTVILIVLCYFIGYILGF